MALPLEYKDDIRKAVEVLRKGGVILYPTDTVWGIGCDATNEEAVRKIFEIKRRADSKALITLVGSLAQLERTVDSIPDVAYELIEASDRPITIVYDHPDPRAGLAPSLLAEDGTVGVRLTQETVSQALCMGLGRPIVSTSANISGEAAAPFFADIKPEIKDAVDYVCTSRRGDRKAAQPSMVMRLSESGVFKILRP